eukprot:764111-Hanusia_phi.AAC.2
MVEAIQEYLQLMSRTEPRKDLSPEPILHDITYNMEVGVCGHINVKHGPFCGTFFAVNSSMRPVKPPGMQRASC